MRMITLLFMCLCLSSFVGCKGGEKAAAPANDENSSNNIEEPTPEEPIATQEPDPGNGGNPTEPEPVTATPGETVPQSDGTPGATYPSIGSPMSYDQNPAIEPNTDVIVPIITITNTPNPYIPQNSGTISLWAADEVNGSGLKNIECSIDGGAYSDCSAQVDMSNLSEGMHQLEARAEDWDGNQSTEVSYAFYVDTQAPNIAIVNAPDAMTTETNSSFQFQADDAGSGLDYYQCRVDTGTLQICSETKDLQNLADGKHALYVRAVDSVGNKSDTLVHHWVVDNSGPDIIFTTQPNPVVHIETDNPMLQFSVSDIGSPVGIITTCQLNGQAIACASGATLNVPTTTPESFVFTVTATDVVGNTSSSSIQWQSQYLDDQGPNIQFTIQPNPIVYIENDTPMVQFVVSDELHPEGITSTCQLNGQAIACASGATLNVPTTTPESFVFTVTATDVVGNTSSSSIQWQSQYLDNQGPNIEFTIQPTPIVYIENDTPMVQFVVSDELHPEGITSTCQLNGQAIACASGATLNVPTTTPESFVFTVTATDVVGNMSTATIQWQSQFLAESKTTLKSIDKDRPVDILFVVDNSGSMNYERSNLAQRIDGMISQIMGLDWQIAITSTDSTNSDDKSDGKLLELHGLNGEYILDASMDVDSAQTIFGNTVQNFGGGSGNEEGIYSSQRVIERYLNGSTEHGDFLRDGADLSIVVLSDEDEHSNGSNIRTTPQEFVNFVDNSFSGAKNMVFHSIIARPGDTTCLEGEGAVAGHTYDELSRLTGFGQVGGAIIGSVCELDYTSQLQNIGQSVKDLQNSIPLDCEPFDSNNDGQPDITISYRADASSAYTVYTADRQYQGNVVTFTELLPPGDYKADYQCEL